MTSHRRLDRTPLPRNRGAASVWLLGVLAATTPGCAALETTSLTASVDAGPATPDAEPPPAKPPRKPVPGANDADACDGVDAWGTCIGLELRRCEEGRLVRTPCVAPTPACAWVDDRTGFACVGGEPGDDAPAPPGEDPAPVACGDVDYLGACDGDVALYCHRGRLERVDCGTWGQFCRFVGETTGFYCTPDASLPQAPPADESPEAPPAPDEPEAPPAPPVPDAGAPPPPDAPPDVPPDDGAPDPPDEPVAPAPPEPESAPAPRTGERPRSAGRSHGARSPRAARRTGRLRDPRLSRPVRRRRRRLV